MKKKLFAIIFTAILAVSAAPCALAAEADAPATESKPLGIEARADIIQYRYRVTPDGRLQVRRWNSTRGYWVDPYWKDVPKSA